MRAWPLISRRVGGRKTEYGTINEELVLQQVLFLSRKIQNWKGERSDPTGIRMKRRDEMNHSGI